MSNLSLYQFNSKNVRTIYIDGVVWFVLADVLIGIESKTRPSDAKTMLTEELGDGVVNNYPILDSLGREQTVLIINEMALTFLIARSRTELGKRFNRWIHGEVLPSIRKTGQYSLPQRKESKALCAAREVHEIQSLLENNPRLCQFLIDHCVNEVLELPAFPGSAEPVYRGVVEIAEDQGFPVSPSNRSQLGKFVASQLRHLAKKEKRLCNGEMREIYCYPDTDEVRSVIAQFFA